MAPFESCDPVSATPVSARSVLAPFVAPSDTCADESALRVRASRDAEVRSGARGVASQGVSLGPRPFGQVSRRSGGQERATSEQTQWGFQLHTQPLGSIE